MGSHYALHFLSPAHTERFFCRKELREKVGVKVRFFLGLSQRIRPIFCRKQLREKIGPIFTRTKSQRTRTDFLSEILCVTIAGEVSLLDDVTPIFSLTEVSHLRSPRLLCVRSLGSPWYDYVYFNSASSGIQ